MPSQHRITAIVLMAMFLAAPSFADVLVLKNGDRITGDVKRIWDLEVTIEPDYSDKFSVDLDAVAYIASERQFEVDLPDGRKVTAQLVGVDEKGIQVIEFDGEAVSMPLSQLLELEEPEDYFDWETRTDINVAVNKGNTDSEKGKLYTYGMVKIGDHRHLAEITLNREAQDGQTTKEQDLLTYNYNWLFNDPWFVGLNTSYERDPVRQLDHRFIGSISMGRDIWARPHRTLNFNLGVGAQEELIEANKNTSLVATWALRFAYDFLNDKLETFHNHTFSQTIKGRDNLIIKTTTGLRFEVTDLLYTTLSVDWNHESNPADLAKSEDLAFLFGLGLEFDR